MNRLVTPLVILAVLLPTVGIAQTNAVSYDWKSHLKRIDTLFEKRIPEVLKGERAKIDAVLDVNKARQYMKYFEQGLRSQTGIIKLEGGERRWLEVAYQAGYRVKTLFRHGYFAGLTRAAEGGR